MHHNTHDYVGECEYEGCMHASKSIYKSYHAYKHFENKLVHDSCYHVLYKPRKQQLQQQRIHSLQQRARDIQQEHPPIIFPPPPRSAVIPAITIAMEDNTLPSVTTPCQQMQHQQILLEVIHSFIECYTYNQYTAEHPIVLDTYNHDISKIYAAGAQLYDDMVDKNIKHMKLHTTSDNKYKVTFDFSWTHKNSHATGGWMALMDVQTNIVLIGIFKYKSRQMTTKIGEKKIVAHGNYPNNKSAHAMEQVYVYLCIWNVVYCLHVMYCIV